MTSAGRPFLPRLPSKGPLLRPTLERLGRFGFRLPSVITVHLDAGYDSAIRRFRPAMNSSVASRYVTYFSVVAGAPERSKLSKGGPLVLLRSDAGCTQG